MLDVESDSCEHCGATLHVCDHRFHRIHTLQGPVELPCRLAHCSDCLCPLRCVVVHDACATRDQEFEGVAVPAGQVHAAFMAALRFGYATALSTEEYLGKKTGKRQ